MEHFTSFGQYLKFSFAREFIYRDETKGDFSYNPNALEKLGGYLVAPLMKPSDSLLKNIRNPLVITALTIGAIFVATLVFYPAVVVSLLQNITVLKFAICSLVDVTILGLGLRTLGRLGVSGDNGLLSAWDKGEIIPVPIGASFLLT